MSLSYWHTWYQQYDEPSSSLNRRLAVVRQRTAENLAGGTRAQPFKILSLCAGDGRDIIPLVAGLEEGCYQAALVEIDDLIASSAVAHVNELGLQGVTVTVGDAGVTSTFAALLPVDMLLLCGIFGNISEEDIQRTVAGVPAMLRPGGTAIWTRGAFEVDIRPLVRAWFVEAGLEEIAFDGEPEGYGVGVARKPLDFGEPAALPERLFSFVR